MRIESRKILGFYDAHHACLEQGAGQRLRHKYLPGTSDVMLSSALEVKVQKHRLLIQG